MGLCLLACAACGPPFPGRLLDRVDRGISFEALRADPAAYRGRWVLLGGEIIETRNRRDGTRLVILQRRLHRSGHPRDEDATGGRFLVFTEAFLDPVVYAPGRSVTVVGEVTGSKRERIGEVDYRYPVIHAGEIHLWEDRGGGETCAPWPAWYRWEIYGPPCW